MKYCGVRHGKNKKVYYFKIPNNITGVKVGSRVLCDTSIGEEVGKVVTITEAESDAALKSVIGSNKPIRGILAVCNEYYDINKIKIPSRFSATTPSTEKLIRRVNEYGKFKKFRTMICVDSNGVLRDGYSAYLAAKFLGLKVLEPCYVVPKTPYVTEETVE